MNKKDRNKQTLNNKKIKYEVIGWTSFANKKYQSFDSMDRKNDCAARLAVIDEIRKNGYSFGGDAHQDMKGCAPVLNNGEIYRCSMRTWGAIMAEAWDATKDNGYMIWYIMDKKERKLKYPKNEVNRKKIVKSDVEFDTTVPEGYEPYGASIKDIKERRKSFEKLIQTAKAGIFPPKKPLVMEMTLNDEPFKQICEGVKTVEVRLNDEKRQILQVGDIIQFLHKGHTESHIQTEVVAIHKFSSFAELFASDLATKTGLGDYTIEEATKKMYNYYNEADEKKNGVLAIEIKVLTK